MHVSPAAVLPINGDGGKGEEKKPQNRCGRAIWTERIFLFVCFLFDLKYVRIHNEDTGVFHTREKNEHATQRHNEFFKNFFNRWKFVAYNPAYKESMCNFCRCFVHFISQIDWRGTTLSHTQLTLSLFNSRQKDMNNQQNIQTFFISVVFVCK